MRRREHNNAVAHHRVLPMTYPMTHSFLKNESLTIWLDRLDRNQLAHSAVFSTTECHFLIHFVNTFSNVTRSSCVFHTTSQSMSIKCCAILCNIPSLRPLSDIYAHIQCERSRSCAASPCFDKLCSLSLSFSFSSRSAFIYLHVLSSMNSRHFGSCWV